MRGGSLDRVRRWYRLGHQIDEGGFGAIFAIESDDDEPRVVKLMPRDRISDARALHESKLGAAVGGRRFPKLYAAGSEGPYHYLVMERIEGWNLAAVCAHARRARRRFSIASAVALVEDTLIALHALHEAVDPETGLPLQAVHRDVKLSNVMLRRDGQACLIDLGVGKSNVQTWRTRTGALVGTLGYISPEQARGDAVNRRADVYATGVMLYALLTFEPLIAPGTPVQMMRRMNQQPFVPPSVHRPEIPAALDDILRRAVERRPDDRFRDATEMRDALAREWPSDGAPLLAYAEEHLALDDAGPTVLVSRPRIYRPTESLFEAQPPSLVGPLLAATLVAGLAGVVAYSAFPNDPPAPPVKLADAPSVVPRPTAVADAPEAIEIEPETSAPPEPPKRSPVRRAPPPPIATPPPTIPKLVDALLARAEDVRRRAPDHGAAIDDIIADAALWRRAADQTRAREELDRLARRLDALDE